MDHFAQISCLRALPAWLLLLSGVISGAGCAQWSTRPASDELGTLGDLPTAKRSGNRIMLEVAHVTIDEKQLGKLRESWREIDELALPAEIRSNLGFNGIRVGRMGANLPPYLRQLVDQPRDQLDPEEGAVGLERLKLHRMQITPGKEKDMPIGSSQELLSLLRKEKGSVRGKTLDDAQCMLSMRVEHANSGGMLSFRPWIVYGPVKQSYSGQDGAWRITPEREQVDFPELEFSAPLAPGETLLMTANDDPRGLGKQFFQQKQGKRLLLLIRLASSQSSPLFEDADLVASPISSLAE